MEINKVEKELKHIIELYTQKRYKIISEDNMDVDSHNVLSQVKKGRKLVICSCCNDTKFCNESPICRHKRFFLMYPLLKLFDDKINLIINTYKDFEFNNLKIDSKVVLDDLQKLKLKDVLK